MSLKPLRGKEEGPEALFEEGQEHFWKTVIDTMIDGLMVVDVEGVILSVNLAMEHITGYTREELIGQPCTILKCHTCLDSVVMGRKKECELFRRGHVRRRKCILERKDGTPLPVMKNAAILKDSAGKVVAGVENLTDLSEVEAKERVISHLRRELSHERGPRTAGQVSRHDAAVHLPPAPGTEQGRRFSRHHREVPGHGAAVHPDLQRRPIRGAGGDLRRVGHRQRAGGRGHPPPQPQAPGALHQGEQRRPQ